MNYTLIKTIVYIAMVLTSSLVVIHFIQYQPIWKFWLLVFSFFAGIYFMYIRPRNRQQEEHEIYTILPRTARQALLAHRKPNIKCKQLKLLGQEELYWMDQMRTNYYRSKPHVFYLTNLRLICLDEDFYFVHPLKDLKFDFDLTQSNEVNIHVQKAQISFLCASKEEMKSALSLIQNESVQKIL